MSYSGYKLIHFLSLILWLGPATGAYWILIRLEKKSGPSPLLEKFYEEVLIVEHLAFILLLLSGWALWREWGTGLFQLPWLKVKLLLVAVILMIELFDIGLSHIYFRIAIRGHLPTHSRRFEKFKKIRGTFYALSIPLLLILIFLVFFLAFFKPSQLLGISF